MRLKSVILLAVLVSSYGSAQEPSPSASAEPSPLQSLLFDLCSANRSIQREAVEALNDLGDLQALPALTALRLGSLYLWTEPEGTEKVVIGGLAKEDETGERYLLPIRDALTDAPLLDEAGAPLRVFKDELKKARVNNSLRRIIRPALDRLRLRSSDPEARRTAAVKLGNSQNRDVLHMLEQALEREETFWTRHALEEAIWIIQLTDEEESARRSAAEMLATLHAPNGLVFMQNMLEEDENGETAEKSETVRETLKTCIGRIQRYQSRVELISTGFYGISLGAVLMMIALGLAITFGLMGVINMAHGELMLVGAYTAYVIQSLFKTHLSPEVFDWYFLLALPLAFAMAALVGLILEAGVLRFLYGRPLETLLLTWGISLILQQLARHIFGAANVNVTSPSFLRGGLQVMVGLVLPYNRLFIIGFSLVCLLGCYLILFRTSLGLRIRAVTQNREISACLGIATRKVDAWTFAFGAGLAGIAGCELSVLGNVGPDLGQTYIVDAFMVVVLGGVGKLVGTVSAAFGIGMLSKTIEPFADAVMGKVIVLVILVLFLQRRPGGLFPAKGRQVDM